jgi:hypothetical protein
MRNDRLKSGFKLKGRTDAEIEAMAKMSPVELSAHDSLPTMSIPSRWPSASPECCARRATKGCSDQRREDGLGRHGNDARLG